MQEFSDRQRLLEKLMAEVGISNLQELSKIAGVPQLQLIRLEKGLMPKMQIDTVLKLSAALKIPIDDFLNLFLGKSSVSTNLILKTDKNEVESVKEEYQRLQQQIEKQKLYLEEKFQQTSIQTLESWLLQWPAAAAAVKKNSQLSASILLPLVKPIEKLLEQWDIEAIGSIGKELAYDPQLHQLIEGKANPGDLVKIRYLGYRHHNKLLYRAKVSPVKS